MSNIFENAIDKGRMAQKWLNWDFPLCNGETYIFIASNDTHNIAAHIDRLESVIDELMLQLEQERERRG